MVTTVYKADSYDSLWTVKESEKSASPCRTGAPIKCGDIIRLEHNNTQKNLHSHKEYKSALSQRQEVTAYGDDGSGDTGDDWEVHCNDMYQLGDTRKIGEVVKGNTLFFLKHVDTGAYLFNDSKFSYTN